MGARVLVVDDDPWILRMVTATLEKRSYVVDTAKEGRQALERAQANPPDVIISDVMMPVMDGWTFVAHLRQHPRLYSIPVIFLTALQRDDARLAELGLGPEDFLAKPFRFDELEKRVSSALARAQSASGAYSRAAASGSYPGIDPASASGSYPSLEALPAHARHYTPAPGQPGSHGQPGYPQPGYPQPGYPPQATAPAATPAPTYPQQRQQPLNPPPQTAELRPGTGSFPAQRRTTALNGRLEQLQLSSLLVMMEMERKDGVLTLKHSTTNEIGRIFLRRGQVICAKIDEQPGLADRDCVYEILCWKAGTFSFNAMEVDMEDTVQSSTTHLLMEGARLIDEAQRDLI